MDYRKGKWFYGKWYFENEIFYVCLGLKEYRFFFYKDILGKYKE